MLPRSGILEGDSQDILLDDTVNIIILQLWSDVLVDLYQTFPVGPGFSQLITRSVNNDFKGSYNVSRIPSCYTKMEIFLTR